MRPYFTRERFGRPQFLAGLLLLAFLAQALWLVRAEVRTTPGIDFREAVRIGEGWKQWHGHGIAGAPFSQAEETGLQDPFQSDESGFDPEHSPLLHLVTAGPLLAWPHDLSGETAPYWRWLARIPFLACGMFLGASLWYVARRLCGNAGGFIALTFYCFSPSLIQASAVWHTEPEIVAGWGAFGAIFTAIAVAHTLYAPREVVLWNWRRILLLGLSLALAVGCQFSILVLVPISLALMWYVAPSRRLAALAIWVAACGVAIALLLAAYGFDAQVAWRGIDHLRWLDPNARAFAMGPAYQAVWSELLKGGPSLVLTLPLAIAAYLLWPRARYFGNTLPLLLALFFLILSVATAHAGTGFELMALPFLFIFVAGITADLLETSYRKLVLASVWGWLTGNALWNLVQLAKVGHG